MFYMRTAHASSHQVWNALDDIKHAWPDYRPTPLIEAPLLARKARVARLWIKAEAHRPLGNFKALGGMLAGLRAIARAIGATSLSELLARPANLAQMPRLICASEGNHGLAVATAANSVGADSTIFLSASVSPGRIERIKAAGGAVHLVAGTFDDAVNEAIASAGRNEGLLISDTTENYSDPVVEDVMNGYAVIAQEVAEQLRQTASHSLSHAFTQAGVGGLAAALTLGLQRLIPYPHMMIVVEPEGADCVAQGMNAGRPVQISGDLLSSARMLSCGIASAPALEILLRHNAKSVIVDEAELSMAISTLQQATGLQTTASGAAGLAGLLHVARSEKLRAQYNLDQRSSILLCVTEGQ